MDHALADLKRASCFVRRELGGGGVCCYVSGSPPPPWVSFCLFCIHIVSLYSLSSLSLHFFLHYSALLYPAFSVFHKNLLPAVTILCGDLTVTWRQAARDDVIIIAPIYAAANAIYQMVDLETVMSGILDEWPWLRPHRIPVAMGLASIFFLIGLSQVTQVVTAAVTAADVITPTADVMLLRAHASSTLGG